MAFGDLSLDAPIKPNKGLEDGACNRRSCQAEPATFYNHGSMAWYCADCADSIGNDVVNARNWPLDFIRIFPGKTLHPMFETRAQILAREQAEEKSTVMVIDEYADILPPPRRNKSVSLQRLLKKAKRHK